MFPGAGTSKAFWQVRIDIVRDLRSNHGRNLTETSVDMTEYDDYVVRIDCSPYVSTVDGDECGDTCTGIVGGSANSG